MSTKSSGPSSAISSGRDNKGMPSMGVVTASSTMPTILSRDATRGSDWNAGDRKSTRLNSSHGYISYAVFCLKKKKRERGLDGWNRTHLQSTQQRSTPYP